MSCFFSRATLLAAGAFLALLPGAGILPVVIAGTGIANVMFLILH
jgi:hypothetical protein